jgi:predicted nucleic acid-binding protein
MSFVLDSSVALGWVYIDERTPAALALFDRVVQTGAWVPSIWHLEIANSLQLSVTRGRVDATFRDQSLADLVQLNIAIDRETHVFAWTATLALADRFRLTLYDACYLELAQRRELPLATLDRELRAAGRTLGLELLGV